MVDFQSRDTRRDDGDEGETADAGGTAETDGNASDDGDGASGDDGRAHEEREERDGGGEHAHDDHHAHDEGSVAFGVVTVSSSRAEGDADPSGEAAVELAEAAGQEVTARSLVDDEFDDVQGTVDRLVRREAVDAVVTTGGTGVTPDDVTVEAVRPLFDKRLPGFGEVFRRLSYEDVGTRVVGTRAAAGVAAGVPVFCLPGSEDAVRLGVEEVVLPEIEHLVGLARRPAEDEDANGTSGAER